MSDSFLFIFEDPGKFLIRRDDMGPIVRYKGLEDPKGRDSLI